MIAKAEAKRKAAEVVEIQRRAAEVQRLAAEAQRQREQNYITNYERIIRNNLNNNLESRFQLQDLNRELGLVNLLNILNRINRRLVLRIGNVYYVLSETTRQKLVEAIANQFVVLEGGGSGEGSDAEFVATWAGLIGDLVITEFNATNNYERANGAFFPFTHNTVFDLQRYGLFKTGEVQNHTDTCLIVALRNGGLEDRLIERIKLIVKNRIIPQTKLNEVCDVAKIKIKLKKDNDKHTHVVYGKQYERVFEIGLLCDHYFLVEKTEITSYCIHNYEKVKDEKDFHSIVAFDKWPRRRTDRFIDSFDVVKALLVNKDSLLKEISMEDRVIASTQFYSNVKQEIGSLAFDDSCFKLVVEEKEDVEDDEGKKKSDFENVVFDFETDPNGTHKPYLVRIYNDTVNKAFFGDDCGLQMLRSLKKNTRLIAHNATYDYRFIIDYLWNIEEIARGNKLISLKARFGSGDKFIKIEVKDSYHLISMALSKFPKVFGLSSEKEVMPYKLYTQENIQKRYINIKYVLDNFIGESNKLQFLNNINRWKLQKEDDYDILEYSSRYCEIDCKILFQGYNIFRSWMLQCTKIDINKKLTIASLAHQYFIDEGCYDGVYQLGGIPQLFIQGCVVGGRTMTASNEKISIAERINDFDAVSLYPSAMARMPGFLKGKPKIIENLSYDWLKTQDGYFVDIVINSVGIKRAFPLMSFKNEDGVRMFSNDMTGKTIRVDKITLEDLITFQQITFSVVRGYYFNDGFNTQVCVTIKELFEERLIKKKAGNPVEMVYKLIMNSSYGKSIMKPIESESRFFDDEKDFGVYLSRNYNWVTSFVKFGSKTKVNSVKILNEHFNIAQVGVCILSMSKRIMNEVMCLAEDNGLDIYYQDTDSMHLKDVDIPKLSEIFKAKYNKELIGKKMGQFHSDFGLEDELNLDTNGDAKDCENIIAVRSIFLGKKSYIDELQGTNIKGEIVTGYHIRMKGIPNKCLLYSCKINNFKNPFELYEHLYKGNKIQIDLTNDGEKANFKFNKDYSCETLSIFNRTISF